MPYVEELAQACGAEIVFLDVIEKLPPHAVVVAPSNLAQGAHHHAEEIKSYVEQLAAQYLARGFAARSIVMHGAPADGILAGADQEHADLIAMASHVSSGLTRLFTGSVASEVLHHAAGSPAADQGRGRWLSRALRLRPHSLAPPGPLARSRSDSAEDVQLELCLLPVGTQRASAPRTGRVRAPPGDPGGRSWRLWPITRRERSTTSPLPGSGEPTLHSGLGWIIRRIKEQTAIPLAVITNGSLLYLPEVRAELLPADVVMPTLSAGTAELYRRIHRPHPEATFERLVAGLTAFRGMYTGQLWIEVMLLGGLNDEEEALRDLAAVLHRLQPDQVHLVLPERPPAEPWVRPPDAEGMVRVVAVLGSSAHVVHALPVDVNASDYATPADAIVSIVTRHPMSRAQLHQALHRWRPAEVDVALLSLRENNRVYPVERLGTEFWVAEGSHFPG